MILAHRNADFDGVASALLLKHFFENKVGKNVIIGVPEGIAKPVKDLLEKLGFHSILENVKMYEKYEDVSNINIDNVIIVDTSSIAQLGDFSKLLEKTTNILVIDHHVHHEGFPDKTLLIADPQATSTCEIILRELADSILDSIPEWLTVLCIAAIIVDSRRFSRASDTTFNLMSLLLRRLKQIKYENIVQSLQQREMRFDEKMARIKGMMRLEAYRYDEKVICLSHVSAHEASLARLLLEAGCDTVIIVSEHDDEIRLFARTKESTISMAELCTRVASKLGGQGGGHDKAGAAAIKVSKETRIGLRRVMRECIRELSSMLNTRLKKVRP